MNDIIKDGNSFEDIGAEITLSGGSGSSISNYNNNLYVTSTSGSTVTFQKYSTAGTRDSSGDITLQFPSSDLPPVSSPIQLLSSSIYDNKIYIALQFGNTIAQSDFAIYRYTISGTYEGRELLLPRGNFIYNFDVNSTTIVATIYISSPPDFLVRVYRRSDDSLLNSFASQTSSTNFPRAVSFTSNRIFVSFGTSIRAYNHDAQRQTSDDFTASTAPRSMTFIGSTFYGLDRSTLITSDSSTPAVATAAWSGVSYTGGKLTGTMTFSGADVTNIETSDFEVVDNSSTPVVQTGWTFDALSSSSATAGTGFTVSATPPANRNNSFKLRLKATNVRSGGSSTDNAPAANVDSTAVAVDNRSLTSITGSFAAPSYNTETRAISSVITFNPSAPNNFQNSAFKVDKRSGAGTSGDPYVWTEQTTGWIITSTGSGTSRTIIATPGNTVSSGTYRIRLPQNGFRTNQPSAETVSDGRTITAPSAIIATFGTVDITSTNAVRWRRFTSRVTFNAQPQSLSASNFKYQIYHISAWIDRTNPLTLTEVSPTEYDLTVTQGSNHRSRFVLEQNSITSNQPISTARIEFTPTSIPTHAIGNFTAITYNNNTRSITSRLVWDVHFNADRYVRDNDFPGPVVEKRSGAGTNDDPYVWTEQTTGWTITTVPDPNLNHPSSIYYEYTATPDITVSGGTYRLTFKENTAAYNEASKRY